MEQAGMTPEKEKLQLKKWLLLIGMLLSLALLVTAVLFLVKIKGWQGGRSRTTLLTIVNTEQGVPDDLSQRLSFIDDEHMLDERCAAELESMLAACRAAGFDCRVTAAYRSESEQRELFNARVEEMIAEGRSEQSARDLALREIDPPGCSEHQLGLAADLRGEQDEEGTRAWLASHAWEYGFILRYPEGKESVTGHPFVPEHFRYVGRDAAKQIHELNITLEEYVSMFYSG